MSFYTTRGDDGTTNLLGEGRVTKYHARIEAVGTLDESSAALGLARAAAEPPGIRRAVAPRPTTGVPIGCAQIPP